MLFKRPLYSTLTKDFPHSLTTYEKSIVAKKNFFFADLIPSDVDQLLFSRKKRTIRFSTQEREKEKQLASTSAVIQSPIFACMHTYYNLCVRDIPWILGSCCCCSVLLPALQVYLLNTRGKKITRYLCTGKKRQEADPFGEDGVK